MPKISNNDGLNSLPALRAYKQAESYKYLKHYKQWNQKCYTMN